MDSREGAAGERDVADEIIGSLAGGGNHQDFIGNGQGSEPFAGGGDAVSGASRGDYLDRIGHLPSCQRSIVHRRAKCGKRWWWEASTVPKSADGGFPEPYADPNISLHLGDLAWAFILICSE